MAQILDTALVRSMGQVGSPQPHLCSPVRWDKPLCCWTVLVQQLQVFLARQVLLCW